MALLHWAHCSNSQNQKLINPNLAQLLSGLSPWPMLST
jgi:hypothetical protein